MAAELSREDVREELRAFAQKSLRRELKDFGVRLQRSICDELNQTVTPAVGEITQQQLTPPLLCETSSTRDAKPRRRSVEDQQVRVMHCSVSDGCLVPEPPMKHLGPVFQPIDCLPPELPGFASCDQTLLTSGPCTGDAKSGDMRICAPTIRAAACTVATTTPQAVCRIPTGCSAIESRRTSLLALPGSEVVGKTFTSCSNKDPRRGSLQVSAPAVSRTPSKCSAVELRRSSMSRRDSAGASRRNSLMPGSTQPGNANACRRSSRRLSFLFTPGEDEPHELPTFFGFRGSRNARRNSTLQPDAAPMQPDDSDDLHSRRTSLNDTCLGHVDLTGEPGPKDMDTSFKRAALALGKRNEGLGSKTWWFLLDLRLVLKELVATSTFDGISALLVLIYAICIGWQTDHAAATGEDELPTAFRIMDKVFCAVFTIEILLRIGGGGCDFFWGSEWRWNSFDVLMVAMQLGEEMIALFTPADAVGSNFSFLRMLRLLRLVKVLRIVRVVRFIRELRRLVCSIGNSLQSLAWTVVLIVFMLYVVGVCFTQTVTMYAWHNGSRGEALDKYFGSLGSSVLSLFQAMSGGIDWDDLSRPLSEIHWVLPTLFCTYIAFSVLAMMNVVTGVFVDSAVQSSQKDHEKDLVMRIREFSERGDVTGSGHLSWDEFEYALNAPGAGDILSHMGMSQGEARHLFELLDVNDDGEINSDDFIMGCLRLHGPAKSVDLVTMMYDTKRNMGMLQKQFDELCQLLKAQQSAMCEPVCLG